MDSGGLSARPSNPYEGHLRRISTDADHEAVLACAERHQVVVAPPGTGKTFLSIRLAAHLARDLPDHAHSLVLTFSNQARTQLEQHADRLLDRPSRGRILVTNYHRLFWHGVRAYRSALGLPASISLSSRSQRTQAFFESGLLKRNERRPPGLYESLAEHAFDQFKDERTPAERSLAGLLAVIRKEQAEGRVTFDDFGALFWRLLTEFPSVATAYETRYPVVIADEHQDASALQDAVVRRLGSKHLIVLADHMQLIHGFRGAEAVRLEQHVRECGKVHELRTPHRWHDRPESGDWLLAIRKRLQGERASARRPSSVVLTPVPRERGRTGMKAPTKFAVLRAFQRGALSVAVLARSNDEIDELRDYLCRAGLFPRHIGGDHVDRGLRLVQDLRDPMASNALAERTVDELFFLVPTLGTDLREQIVHRLGADGVDMARCGPNARRFLVLLSRLYDLGVDAFFTTLSDCLAHSKDLGHHLPRARAVRVIVETAGKPSTDPVADYGARMSAEAHATERTDRGLFVMTVHQAKGKEFDEVVLVNASADAFPSNDDGVRLFYVGITRARRGWSVIFPQPGVSDLVSTL